MVVRLPFTLVRSTQRQLTSRATYKKISNAHTIARLPFLTQRSISTTFQRSRASPIDQHRQQGSEAAFSAAATSSQDNPIVTIDGREGKVGVTWSSGIESKYHNVWLRDHCRCADCYHPQTKQRQLATFSIPLDIQPHSVEATTEGLLVHWPNLSSFPKEQEHTHSSPSSKDVTITEVEGESIHNYHASLYPWSWLYANSYSPSLSLGGLHAEHRAENAIMWGSGIAQQPPTVTWEEVMDPNTERGVARWVNKIAQFGFCFVSGVPATPEDTEQLIKKIAFIRETHYGGFWDFTSDLSHGDTAYTNLALGAHTDTTYFTDPAGLQMFHLLSHTEATKDGSAARGGESLLVDGFFAAKILREVYPEAYRVLSTTRISTHSAGDDSTLIRPLQSAGYPILEHDRRTGELIRVRYNNDDRSVLRMREEEVIPFYDALNKWHEILTNRDSEYWSQLRPGQALIFDNNRVLHGRSAFTGNRRLCGAYINHDDFRSRLAVLRKRFPDLDGGLKRSSAATPSGEIDGSNADFGARRGVWDDGL